MTTTEPTDSTSPKTRATRGSMRAAGIGRFMVRDMSRSMSRSYHMLMAPEAPAPMAMQVTATTAVAGSTAPGASSRPTRAVKTTSDMTRGLRMMA